MAGISNEAQLSIAASSMFPGFRFSPTDEELITYYLHRKLESPEKSVEVISDVDICNFEPWDLPAVDTSENVVSENGTDKGEKAMECNSKNPTSSNESLSIEQMDSTSEWYHHLTPELTHISSGLQRRSYDDDFFADILNDDIIKLDESSVSVADNILPVANHSEAQEESTMQGAVSQAIPFQGTASRRIRLKKTKLRFHSLASIDSMKLEQSQKGLASSQVLMYVVCLFLVMLILFMSNFCFSSISQSVSFYVGRFLASEKLH